MSDKSYRDEIAKREVLEQLDALGISFRGSCTVDHRDSYGRLAPCPDELRPETDDELEPRATAAETWEVDWLKAAGCVFAGLVCLGFWGLVLWTAARVLRGG